MNALRLSVYLLLFSIMLCLIGCSSAAKESMTPPSLQPANIKIQPIESPNEIFKLDESLVAQLDSHLTRQNTAPQLAHAILNLLLTNGDASLAYQSGATLTAAQSYQNLNANCLSLSILAYSLAEHLGLQAQFQKVHIPEYWALTQGVNFLTGHINLTVANPANSRSSSKTVYQRDNGLVIDFYPASRQARFKTSLLSKATVTAMFYNNKGAVALINEQYDLAYSYFNAATTVAPGYSAAWGNLGILYRHLGHLNAAELAYNYAIYLDKNNHTALGNLAVLYQLTHREQQGQQILKQLDNKRQSNPYYHISLGNADYAQNNYAQALKHFKKAYSLAATLHEAHFGLARVYFQWGELSRADYHLRQAGKKADFAHDQQRYATKLNALQAYVLEKEIH